MTENPIPRRDLIQAYAVALERLESFDIRSVGDYAEVLVAEALAGKRVSRNTKGHDVLAPLYGRIEIKCRVLPRSGKSEQRATLGISKMDGFDYLALVTFHRDLSVKTAVIVPHAATWEFVQNTYRHRIKPDEALKLTGAKDISEAIQKASEK